MSSRADWAEWGFNKTKSAYITLCGMITGLAVTLLGVSLGCYWLNMLLGGIIGSVALATPAWFPMAVVVLAIACAAPIIFASETGLLRQVYKLATIPGEAFAKASIFVVAGATLGTHAAIMHVGKRLSGFISDLIYGNDTKEVKSGSTPPPRSGDNPADASGSTQQGWDHREPYPRPVRWTPSAPTQAAADPLSLKLLEHLAGMVPEAVAVADGDDVLGQRAAPRQ